MKKILSYIAIVTLLSGCAKVTQESAPCIGPKPGKPIVQDLVIYPGGYGTAEDIGYHTGVYTWTGPGFSQTTQSGSVGINIPYTASSTYPGYGLYTVSYTYNGCSSDMDSFYITPSPTAAPPCTIASGNYNKLITSTGVTFQMSGGTMTNNTYVCGSSSGSSITATAANGFSITLGTFTTPSSGGYSDLAENCNINGTDAYISIFDGFGQQYYASTGGRVYYNVINGVKYVTLCSATFLDLNNYTNLTITGNFSYH